MLLTGVRQKEVRCSHRSIQLIQWFSVLLDTAQRRGVFCCHLVRIPWSLIEFKETACLLHATAAGKQEAFLVFLSNPAAIFSAIPGGVSSCCCSSLLTDLLPFGFSLIRLDRVTCTRVQDRMSMLQVHPQSSYVSCLFSAGQFHLVFGLWNHNCIKFEWNLPSGGDNKW